MIPPVFPGNFLSGLKLLEFLCNFYKYRGTTKSTIFFRSPKEPNLSGSDSSKRRKEHQN